MRTMIKALYGPILHPVDAANFTDEDGDVYRLHGEPKFKTGLGQQAVDWRWTTYEPRSEMEGHATALCGHAQSLYVWYDFRRMRRRTTVRLKLDVLLTF
jgi:hypothetical protein